MSDTIEVLIADDRRSSETGYGRWRRWRTTSVS